MWLPYELTNYPRYAAVATKKRNICASSRVSHTLVPVKFVMGWCVIMQTIGGKITPSICHMLHKQHSSKCPSFVLTYIVSCVSTFQLPCDKTSDCLRTIHFLREATLTLYTSSAFHKVQWWHYSGVAGGDDNVNFYVKFLQDSMHL